MNARSEPDLFGPPQTLPAMPAGFKYEPGFLTPGEEAELTAQMTGLDFKEFEFQGFLGKRRTVSFGWRYDFNGGGLQKTNDLPAFLLPVRERAARFAARTLVSIPPLAM